jgi:hypothetical protein
MNKRTSTRLIGAALLVYLTGCVAPVTDPLPIVQRQAIRKALAPICPTPTPGSKITIIASELEAAINAGVPPDTLAAEWERLQEGAMSCKGMKK